MNFKKFVFKAFRYARISIKKIIFFMFKFFNFIKMYNSSSDGFRKKFKFSKRTCHNFNYLLYLAILPHGVTSGEFVFVLPPCG